MGEDLAGARLQGGDRLSDQRGSAEGLDALGFNLVGYGCTTCIGNSGPLPQAISDAINADDLVAVSVLSGNRNFEGRVNPDVRANYLASPPLVVAYALAGSMQMDIVTEPLGVGKDGAAGLPARHLADQRGDRQDPAQVGDQRLFTKRYSNVFDGDKHWQSIKVAGGQTYAWDSAPPTCRTRRTSPTSR